MTHNEFLSLYLPLAETHLFHPVFTDVKITEKLCGICDRLAENAKRFNLTAITAPADMVEKHIIDSLIPLDLLRKKGILDENFRMDGKPVRMCDIGAGAGFPSLPMAAVLAEFDGRVLAVDATAKKVRYINETAEILGIPRMSAESGRAEELAVTGLRETFSLVTARAVANLRVLTELCAPFAMVGGYFMPLKAHAEEEIAEAGKTPVTMGLHSEGEIPYALPSGDTRTLLLYKKVKPTPPQYPRPYAKILAGK
ncbi:MAG: 16S rRNA (guanine(527)-N(7))-methyltransferase RsmG [Clostridia bacterium]|nr:16S rRNA (guanine(527)-N(7))-methyltransferase RsmG [Clostridia bacterium]